MAVDISGYIQSKINKLKGSRYNVPAQIRAVANEAKKVPLREWTPFTSQAPIARTIQDLTTGVVKRGVQGAMRYNPAYNAYRSVTGNQISDKEYLKSGADVARLGGALVMPWQQTVGSSVIGGTLNKGMGGDFRQGMIQGIQAGQQYGGLGRLTSPIVGNALSKLPISGNIAQRGAGSVAGVIEGIGQDYAVGEKPNPLSIGMDAVAGFAGYGNINTPKGIGKAMDKNAILTNEQARRVGRLMKEFETTGKLSKDAYTEAWKLLTNETKKVNTKKARVELNRADDSTVYSALKNLMTKNQTYVYRDLAMGAVDLSNKPKPKVDLSNKPQQLNVQKLNLDQKGKETVRKLESTEPRLTMKNKSVVEASDNTNPASVARTMEQTRQVAAKDLATRRKVVKDTNDYFRMQNEGATKAELRKKLLDIAETSKVARQQGTDAARRLQARNILADESATPMQRVFKLLDNAGVEQGKYIDDAVKVDWNNSKSVVDFYRKYVPPTFIETLDEFRYTNMLSSPMTQIVNTFGNALQTSVVTPIEKTVAGGVDWVSSKLTGKEREYFARQGYDYTKGYIKSLPDAYKAFRKTLSGELPITNLDLKDKIPTGTGGFRKLYTTPLRMLEASDQFFRTLVKGGEMESLKTAGVTGEKALKQAEQSADYRLFRQAFDPTGELGQGGVLRAWDKWNGAINNLRNAPGGKWIVPFLQTPTNILKQGVEYSPLGFTTVFGSKNPAEQMAKAIVGSSVFTGAYALANAGLATWDTPTNTKDKQEFYAAGLQPYSIKIGDKWVSYSKLGPLSYPIAMAAAMKYGEENGMSTSRLENMGAGLGRFLGFFADQSYMQGIGDIIDAVRGDEFKRDRALSNIPLQLVPYRSMQGWFARMVDPVYRKAGGDTLVEKVINAVKSQTPFISKTLPAYETPTGEDSPRQFPVFNSFSPLKITQEDGTRKAQYDKKQSIKISEKRAVAQLEKVGAGSVDVGDKVYYYDNDGNIKNIDKAINLNKPNFTGNVTVDKKLLSKHKTDVTNKINDYIDLYEIGAIDQQKAIAIIERLNAYRESLDDIKISQKSGGRSKKGKYVTPTKAQITGIGSSRVPRPRIANPKAPQVNINSLLAMADQPAQVKKLTVRRPTL